MKRYRKWLRAILLLLCLSAFWAILSGRREPKLEQAETAAKRILESLTTDEGQIPVLGPDGTPTISGANEGLAQTITSMLEYELLSVTEDGGTATASVRITAPDTPAILDEVLEEMDEYDVEVFTQRMGDALRTDTRTVEFTVEVTLQGVDGVWYLVPNGQLTNAMTGGLLQVYAQQVQAIREALIGGEDT